MMVMARANRFCLSSVRYYSQTTLLQGKNLVNSNNDATTREEFFKGKKVVLFGVPGAFTPICSQKHVPSYIQKVAEIKSKGIDTVACVSVNDPFVMKAWAENCQANTDDITFLADWDASLVKDLDLSIDLSAANLGVRSKRFSAIINDGKVVKQFVEVSPGEFETTSAENILTELGKEDTDSDSE